MHKPDFNQPLNLKILGTLRMGHPLLFAFARCNMGPNTSSPNATISLHPVNESKGSDVGRAVAHRLVGYRNSYHPRT